MIALLITSEGTRRKVAVPPAPARLVLGSAPTCDVVLTDAAVEARHLAVEMTPGGCRITDLQSRNGTKLNGLFVSQGLVRVGDEIRIGISLIKVVARSGAGASRLEDEQRFGAGDLLSERYNTRVIRNAFEIHQDRTGRRIISPVLEHIVTGHVHLVAYGNELRYADAKTLRLVQDAHTHGA